MGEARRKLDMDACGIPRPRDNTCPACHSKRVLTLKQAEFPPHLGVDCEWQTCRDCKAVWEAFPLVYARDEACAGPCDNCAFRPGSSEQADPAGWRALVESLKPDQSCGHFPGVFYCHKGVPIDMSKGPGNFHFPRRPITMDGDVVRQPDGSIATTEDTAKMRVCSGYLRMIRATRKKELANV